MTDSDDTTPTKLHATLKRFYTHPKSDTALDVEREADALQACLVALVGLSDAARGRVLLTLARRWDGAVVPWPEAGE